ncbi:LytR/AlgR family response regulator transcription factor [Zobellia uliginosa]|uniref:LytR/AlgR family response regulator transcription factor n=1 Tax=Zobellia uliginosa TaxID=143224 RepID=UPI0026E36861|nr:LytTR family DNA-binding domain-containing protein [Zobellia uliginosa]MDO6517639.1 LytTR family DNA-binding domain-containing protein [Zobellia uliginosa]
MKTIKCLVIDDEELARGLLKTYIGRLGFLQFVDEMANPLDALGLMKDEKIDLLFLDIQMPEIKGTDFVKLIPDGVQVIFTTAYSEYALQGYELNVVDYLLKPITFERFLLAVNKVKAKIEDSGNTSEVISDSLTVKSGYDLHKVKYDDLLYIESDSEYVNFYLEDKKLMSLQSLKKLTELLPSDRFMRVHRSYIVNKTKVTTLKGRDIFIGKTEIPVSAQYFEAVKKELFE